MREVEKLVLFPGISSFNFTLSRQELQLHIHQCKESITIMIMLLKICPAFFY